MKLTTLFLIAVYLQVSATGYGQKVTISVKNIPLEKVITKIRQQTGYVFFYDYSIFQNAKDVTLNVHDMEIENVMSECLKDQELEFKILENTITITKKTDNGIRSSVSVEPNARINIKGKVVNEKNEPIIGATITVRGTNKTTITNDVGEFNLNEVDSNATIIISSIGFEKYTVRLKGNVNILAKMKIRTDELDQTTVIVSTGYQQIPKERATGSFVQINNELYNRRISGDVLTKLDGISSGVYFNPQTKALRTNDYTLPNSIGDPNNKLGISIRGQSTLSNQVSKDPLIVIDNFPFEGDINNINPEMVESISILKDAAAASIWGARAGNGVIVITTKKGRFNQKMKLDVNANVSIVNKPDLFYSKNFLNSNDYIDIEDTLFVKGYYKGDLNNKSKYPIVSPVVALLAAQAAGKISPQEATAQINSYRGLDVRNDYDKFIYGKAVNQQYAITMRGGGNNLSYALSIGYDNVNSNLIRNGYKKIVINSNNIYSPTKNLEITAGVTFAHLDMQSNNPFNLGIGPMSLPLQGNTINALYPYARFADANGAHLPINYKLNPDYIDSVRKLGFLDWSYSPLDELSLSDYTTKQKDILLRTGIKYKFFSFLNAEIQYQNETQNSTRRIYNNPQSFYARNLINTYAQFNRTANTFTYPFPQGGILSLTPSNLFSNNVRAQVNYNQIIRDKNEFYGILGAEVRETKSSNYTINMYGYDDQYGTAVSNLNFGTSYNTNPSDRAFLPSPYSGVSVTTDRFVSYYSNLSYTYDSRYTLTVSGRKDGANIFGVSTNDKITPLWSAGLGWLASKERFYQATWLPYLRLRLTYGYNGNVYNTAAYLTANYQTSVWTGLRTATVTSPPNPELRWEKVKNINVGLDFALKNSVLNGTIELYQKKGLDLIEQIPLAPASGFTSFNGNAANTKTNGVDLTLNSKNLNGSIKWHTILLLSVLHDKVTKYDVPQTSQSIQNGFVALEGHPLFGVYSYRWAGIDPTTGDPQGILNGKISKDYSGIINNFKPDSLVYNGSARPTVFGSLLNTFSYKQISISFNITYKLGYVFRRVSTPLNYNSIISGGGNDDYTKRWKKTGDEKTTNVPSVIFPANLYRNQFYQYSSVLVEKGDQIRLQDINISYDLNGLPFAKKGFTHLQVFTYVNNLGIIWKANKSGIDPDAGNGIPNPRSISFGLKAEF